MDNLNVSLSLFNRIPNIIRADLISECFEDLRLQIIIQADQQLTDEKKNEKTSTCEMTSDDSVMNLLNTKKSKTKAKKMESGKMPKLLMN